MKFLKAFVIEFVKAWVLVAAMLLVAITAWDMATPAPKSPRPFIQVPL